MPAGDGTGPRGQGPMTGRGMGYCAGYAAPGYATGGGRGRGFGGGGRGGRGFRNRYYATGLPGWARGGWGPAPYGPPYASEAPYQAPTGESEAAVLRSQAEYLQGALADVKKRLDELEKQSGE